MTFLETIQQDKPVLVDFFAAWCGPCQMMSPILEDVKSRMGDGVSILKVDVDKNFQTAMAYRVQSVPTLILFRNGKALWRQSGVVAADELEQLLHQHS